jgi:hypothetical protein
MEIRLDETSIWLESGEMGAEGVSGTEGFIAETLGQNYI